MANDEGATVPIPTDVCVIISEYCTLKTACLFTMTSSDLSTKITKLRYSVSLEDQSELGDGLASALALFDDFRILKVKLDSKELAVSVAEALNRSNLEVFHLDTSIPSSVYASLDNSDEEDDEEELVDIEADMEAIIDAFVSSVAAEPKSTVVEFSWSTIWAHTDPTEKFLELFAGSVKRMALHITGFQYTTDWVSKFLNACPDLEELAYHSNEASEIGLLNTLDLRLHQSLQEVDRHSNLRFLSFYLKEDNRYPLDLCRKIDSSHSAHWAHKEIEYKLPNLSALWIDYTGTLLDVTSSPRNIFLMLIEKGDLESAEKVLSTYRRQGCNIPPVDAVASHLLRSTTFDDEPDTFLEIFRILFRAGWNSGKLLPVPRHNHNAPAWETLLEKHPSPETFDMIFLEKIYQDPEMRQMTAAEHAVHLFGFLPALEHPLLFARRTNNNALESHINERLSTIAKYFSSSDLSRKS
eukprot:TRINITY_DN5488_c0_g1_i2.p2 TRINITY_DN5488_c0_g1~~TRINITY_DN5488_c0_g1_i2.p2  ORF type:complete len:468 (-),score=61.52 TRINITY_DN5488_c0_g1_i2:1529-2932(-)